MGANLWRSRWIILSFSLLAVAAALVGSLFAPRRYEGRCSLMIEPRKEINPLQVEPRGFQERQTFMETQKELVVSRGVVADAIAKLDGKPVDKVTPDEADSFVANVTVSSRSGLGRAVFLGNGTGETNTFFVGVKAGDPQKAADAANALVSAYMARTGQVRAKMAQQAAGVLQSAADESGKRIGDAYRKVAQIEARAGTLLPDLIDSDKPTLRVFPELDKLRASYESDRAALVQQQAKVAMLRAALKSKGPLAIPTELAPSNTAFTQLKAKQAELRVELEKQRTLFRDDSREVANVREQVEGIDELLRKEAQVLVAGEEQSLVALQVAQQERQHTLAEYGDKVTSLSLLKTEYQEARRVYEGLSKAQAEQLNGLAAAQVATAEQAGGGANVAVLDPAIPDQRPVSPRVLNNALLALVLGFAVGLVYALLRLPPTAPAAAGRRITD